MELMTNTILLKLEVLVCGKFIHDIDISRCEAYLILAITWKEISLLAEFKKSLPHNLDMNRSQYKSSTKGNQTRMVNPEGFLPQRFQEIRSLFAICSLT